jgi:hypothetical protein
MAYTRRICCYKECGKSLSFGIGTYYEKDLDPLCDPIIAFLAVGMLIYLILGFLKNPYHGEWCGTCRAAREYINARIQEANREKNDGETLLHVAARSNNFSVQEMCYFISKDTDLNATNDEGKTPFDVANSEEKKRLLRSVRFNQILRNADKEKKKIILRKMMSDHESYEQDREAFILKWENELRNC